VSTPAPTTEESADCAGCDVPVSKVAVKLTPADDLKIAGALLTAAGAMVAKS